MLIPQKHLSISQWQAEIKSFAKNEKGRLRKILLPMNCSNQAKISLLKGLKQTLKIKLNQVKTQKQKLKSKVTQINEVENLLKVKSENVYIAISRSCLTEVHQVQMQLMNKFEELMHLKEKAITQKKAQLKSQYFSKPKAQPFQEFFIPEAKMTSSVIINQQGNTLMNQSIAMAKDKKPSIGKSVQIRSKMQISKLYHSQIYLIMKPIMSEARQIIQKNKFIICTLKEGHKKQLQLNLWMKEVKIASLQSQLRMKIQNDQQLNAQKQPNSIEKNQSDTTWSPYEKENEASDLKVTSDSKKFQSHPRKNLLEEQKAFSISSKHQNEAIKSEAHQNKPQSQQVQLSPEQGRRKTEKINRPSGYTKNKSIMMKNNEDFLVQQNSGYFADKKMQTASNFNAEQEPSQQELQELIRKSKNMLNESMKKSNLSSNSYTNECQTKENMSYKIDNSFQSAQNKEPSYFSRNRSRLTNFQDVIEQQDQERQQGSSDESLSGEEQVFEVHIQNKNKIQSNNVSRPNIKFAPLTPISDQISANSLPNQNKDKGTSKQLIILTNTPNVSRTIQLIPNKVQPNIFKQQISKMSENSLNVFNSQNKENNPWNSNTNITFQQLQQPSNVFRNCSHSSISNAFSSPFVKSRNEQNKITTANQSYSIFGNSFNAFNKNSKNQPAENVFKKFQNSSANQDNLASSQKGNSNIFAKKTAQVSNPFASPRSSNGFNQTSNVSLNVFGKHQPTNNLFSTNMPFEYRNACQQNKSQESTGKISPKLFAQPRISNDLTKLNGKNDKNVNIFGNPRNYTRSNEILCEPSVKNDQGMKMEKIKQSEFFYY